MRSIKHQMLLKLQTDLVCMKNWKKYREGKNTFSDDAMPSFHIPLHYRLSVCEKALAEYLETKRLAFPRFYFISSVDLLDILSKGNQPTLVSETL